MSLNESASGEVDTDPQKIEELLTRGVAEIFTKEELEQKLKSGKQLHIKLGTDVTGPDLHLGHAVVQRKLRDFQELGHKVTLIIGDFTTLVGDHSDKVDMREETNPETIKQNEEKYKEQFFKTVREDLTQVRHNSEWLKDLNFNDVINLANKYTVAQMIERENFMKRYTEKKPIGLDEFLYPLMQGYDSVALKNDVEIGGTDQTFNLLAGRKLMPSFNLPAQNALTVRLLTGNDGRKMGKSLQNFIPILDNAINMYGKVMSIVDGVIFEYFELITRVPMAEVEKMKKAVEGGENPMKYKKRLAFKIVEFYHSKDDAKNAQKVFEETVQGGEVSDEIKQKVKVEGKIVLFDLLKASIKDASSSDIKRTIKQGGVEVNGEKVTDSTTEIELFSGDIIKFGKRTFLEVE